MMSNRTTRIFPVVVLAAVSSAALGHHSFATHFDFENIIELSGTLTSVEIKSPHSFLGVDVVQDDGSVVNWDIEAHSTALLRRAGITPETLLVGDPIRIRGPRSRRPELNLMFGSELFTSDGGEFETLASIRRPPEYRITDQRDDVSGLERFTGRWLSFVSGQRISDTPLPLNEAGLSARAAYDPQDTPAMNCIPPNLPSILFVPYLYDVRLDGNELLLHHEYFDIERTVMLGSEAPDGSEPDFGQRVGRFTGDAIVIESTNFPPNRAGLAASLELNGNGFDVPSSEQKRFTERYTGNEDGGELTVEYTLEDPVYLSEPYSSEIVFHRVPEDTPMYEFPCDADIATRSTLNAAPREE
jgi:hypothetical protein